MFVWGGSRTWRNVCSGVLTSERKRRRRAGRHFAAAPKLPPPCRWPKPGCALPGPVDGPTPDEMPALARHFWICANSAAVGGLIARSTWIRCPPVRKRATIFGTVPSWWTATSMRPCELADTPFAAAIWRACFSGKVSCVPGRKKSWTKCVPALPSLERSVSTDWLLAMTSPNPPGRGGRGSLWTKRAADGQSTHGSDRGEADPEQPSRAAIGAAAETVRGRGDPDEEVQVVQAPPHAVGDALAVAVGQTQREQQLGRHDADTGPERPVAGREGNDELGEREAGLRVDGDHRDVQDDEDADNQTGEAVDLLEREARPARELLLPGQHEAEDNGAREEQVRDDPAGPRRVPVDRDGRRRHAAASPGGIARRQVRLARDLPSRNRNRPASPRASSHAGPPSPSRKAALAATSARRQVPALTVTSSHGDSDGFPLRGSIRWCCQMPARCQRRLTLPLVASPPQTTRTAPPPGSATSTEPLVARSPPADT